MRKLLLIGCLIPFVLPASAQILDSTAVATPPPCTYLAHMRLEVGFTADSLGQSVGLPQGFTRVYTTVWDSTGQVCGDQQQRPNRWREEDLDTWLTAHNQTALRNQIRQAALNLANLIRTARGLQ